MIVPRLPSASATEGGANIGPRVYCATIFSAWALISGVKSITSSTVKPWRSNAAGFVGNGCVGDVRSPGVFDCGTARSSIGHTGLPVSRSNT